MDRGDILRTADSLINGDRAHQYGPPETNWGNIAALWSAYLGVHISASDVGILNILQKVARLKTDDAHQDSYIDIAGYAALGGEIGGRK